jgi:hypothetical protein
MPAEKIICHQMLELQDLRGRALLLSAKELSEDNQMIKFVKVIDDALCVVDIIQELRVLGHFDFRCLEVALWKFSVMNLESKKQELTGLKNAWADTLVNCRREHLFLNFYHGQQFWILADIILACDGRESSRTLCEDLLSLARPSHNFSELKIAGEKTEAESATLGASEKLSALGERLFEILDPLEDESGHFSFLSSTIEADMGLSAGEQALRMQLLSVQHVDDPGKIPDALMHLFLSRGLVPQAHKIVFCFKTTTEEEIICLLGRFEKSKTGHLHCLANVQDLDNKVQFALVDRLQSIKESSQAQPLGTRQLVLLTSGQEHGSIFRVLVDRVGMLKLHGCKGEAESKAYIKKNLWPRVSTFVSSHPGTGKTERIRAAAHGMKKNTVSFHFSGSVSSQEVVQRLRRTKWASLICYTWTSR